MGRRSRSLTDSRNESTGKGNKTVDMPTIEASKRMEGRNLEGFLVLSVGSMALYSSNRGNGELHRVLWLWENKLSPVIRPRIVLLLLYLSVFTLMVVPSEAGPANPDLRESIQAGNESCFQYFPDQNIFRMNCTVLGWEDHGYDGDTHISLDSWELFDGGGLEGNIIDLQNIWDFHGLLTIREDGNDIESLGEAPLIRNVHLKNGKTADFGGYVVRESQRFFTVESCSSTGDISGSFRSGGICGPSCGRNEGHIKISNSYSTGKIEASGAGGITGALVGDNGGTVNITQCYSSGSIGGGLVEGQEGGICGWSAGASGGHVYITQSYSTGNIISATSGGITGDHAAFDEGEVHITDCYTRGDIDGERSGGITGANTGRGALHITNTYASGIVLHQDAGGIIGHIAGQASAVIGVHHSVYNGKSEANIVGVDESVDSGKSVLQMNGSSDNIDDIRGQPYRHDGIQQWDSATWALCGSDHLPILRFQLPCPTPSPTASPSFTPPRTATNSRTPTPTESVTTSPSTTGAVFSLTPLLPTSPSTGSTSNPNGVSSSSPTGAASRISQVPVSSKNSSLSDESLLQLPSIRRLRHGGRSINVPVTKARCQRTD
eukprot:gb/GECG01003181.1/.p1 GENE.gb/GECG01003181.1/~~gb/GECG01003181.1/.p1  ORF type:complete len:606 (+),score=77.30 gb/GECG01003181.1/:1-1818(+)